VLCVVDDFTWECLALVADTSLSGTRVVRELDAIAAKRGYPARPALTQVARDDDGLEGQGGETALNRTEKHRQDGPDGNRELYF
jgi:transposase InsO family protein